MKKRKYKVVEEEFNELKEMSYEVKEFTPWHFRISKEEKDIYLDIFPTTRVFTKYQNGEYKGKGNYVDLLELVENKI